MIKSKLFDLVKYFLGWPVSIVSILFLIKFLAPNTNEITQTLNHLNLLTLSFSIVCFLAYTAFRTTVWQELLKAQGHKDISFKQNYYGWISSEFKRYTPGNIWSFLSRTVLFGYLGINKKDVAKTLLFEAELVVIGSLLVALFSIRFAFNILPDTKFEIINQPLIVGLTFLLVGLFLLSKRIPFPKFSPRINLKLVGLSFLAFLFFALGSYLSLISLFYINPNYFIPLTGLFSLALLIGYLSIITPMGLGVREAVLFFGLSTVLAPEQAALATLFARVVFIFTEILSLGFASFWKRSKKVPFEDLFKRHLYFIILLIFILGYIAYFTNTSFLRHENFYTGRFDLGNMDQTVWNTVHGRIFQLTNPNGTNITSRLSFHADFILIFLSPFYFFWRDPKTLLFLQSFILPLGAIFVYLISEKIVKNKFFSLILAISFLINPAVDHSNLYDFHPVVLGTTFLLGSFYFLITNRDSWFVIFLILAGLTKENVWVLTALLGLYAMLFRNKKMLGAAIFLISSIIFFYLVLVVMPKLAGGKNFALSYYSDFGDSPLDILKNSLINPIKTVSLLTKIDRLEYLKDLLLPLGFLPLFSPLVLLTIPTLFINMLSNNSLLYQITYQYTATVTPFLFISAIYATKWIARRTPTINITFYGLVILFFSLYSAYDFGPLPGAKYPNIQMYTEPLVNKAIVKNYIRKIPIKYSLATTNNLGGHLSHRQRIYTVPVGIDEADMILFLLGREESNSNVIAEKQAYRKVLVDPNYQKVFEDGSFIVFKKKPLI